MSRAVTVVLAFLFAIGFFVSVVVYGARADHRVGQLELETSPIWIECCSNRDCVAQEVRWMDFHGQPTQLLPVSIDGDGYWIESRKFRPAPSKLTWVCYFDTNDPPMNENVRCVLYPRGGSYAWRHEHRQLDSITEDIPFPRPGLGRSVGNAGSRAKNIYTFVENAPI